MYEGPRKDSRSSEHRIKTEQSIQMELPGGWWSQNDRLIGALGKSRTISTATTISSSPSFSLSRALQSGELGWIEGP
jgi:hypothetical protein